MDDHDEIRALFRQARQAGTAALRYIGDQIDAVETAEAAKPWALAFGRVMQAQAALDILADALAAERGWPQLDPLLTASLSVAQARAEVAIEAMAGDD